MRQDAVLRRSRAPSASALLSVLCLLLIQSAPVQSAHEDDRFPTPQFEAALRNHTRQWLADGHTNNWAVLVSTSIFWHNYRHVANVFSMYHSVKQMGIPDSHIILMVADDIACNARNSYPGTVFNSKSHNLNLYGTDIEVDYRGYEVSVENFLRLLTGKHHEHTPRSKRLLTNEHSNILIYMTGHGGHEFLKFQDFEEICSKDLADAFEQMWEGRRYHEILFMVDTCQAATLYRQFRSPNIIGIGSSSKKENSYSHHSDFELGLAMIDRFTYYTLNFFEKGEIARRQSLHDLFATYQDAQLAAKARYRADLSKRSTREIPLNDFFAAAIEAIPVVKVMKLQEDQEYKAKAQQQEEDRLKTQQLQEEDLKAKYCARQNEVRPIFNLEKHERKPFSEEFIYCGSAFLLLAAILCFSFSFM